MRTVLSASTNVHVSHACQQYMLADIGFSYSNFDVQQSITIRVFTVCVKTVAEPFG